MFPVKTVRTILTFCRIGVEMTGDGVVAGTGGCVGATGAGVVAIGAAVVAIGAAVVAIGAGVAGRLTGLVVGMTTGVKTGDDVGGGTGSDTGAAVGSAPAGKQTFSQISCGDVIVVSHGQSPTPGPQLSVHPITRQSAKLSQLPASSHRVVVVKVKSWPSPHQSGQKISSTKVVSPCW